MSGHNRWSQIKHKKGLTDAKKSKIFSKLIRYISVEAKLSGGKESPGLRSAIEKAKKVNMPAENIERAIKKASEPSAKMDAITYEAYGPGGVGIIIETLTTSKNRTAQEIKHLLSKHGSALAGIGSVTWSFTKPARNASHSDAGGAVQVEKEVPETRQKLRIKLKAYDHKIIDNSSRQIIDIANRYGAEVVGPVPLPTEILKFTVNRSTFVHKDAREQFEMRVHKRIIDIIGPNADIIEALRDLNLPSGVDITIKI